MVALDARPADVDAITFGSILFPRAPGAIVEDVAEPDCFSDLRLDQVVAAIVAGRDEYHLEPFFRTPLRDLTAIAYRHDVFRDLEDPPLLAAVRAFAAGMRTVRRRLSRQASGHYRHEIERWHLNAVETYCETILGLASALDDLQARSEGLAALRRYLASYRQLPPFLELLADARRVRADLGAIRFRLTVGGTKVRVSRYEDEPDYSEEVLATFDKFRQADTPAEPMWFDFSPGWMNHVEAAVLERVALLHPDVFAELDRFGDRHDHFLDDTVTRFDREIQFYLGYVDHMHRLTGRGLRFCYPRVSATSKAIRGREVFDLALAARRLADHAEPVVTNDFRLEPHQRVIVVTGPNQGGKTTFARTIGQLHHLAALGVPVPGTEADLCITDRIFTHFDREESLSDLAGKLEDELRRIRDILDSTTPASLLIMNESFSSTTVRDALAIGERVLRQVIGLDCLCVAVTFLDELSRLGPTVVSMVSEVDPADPAVRTFKLSARPADGLAYAQAIADKHRLGYHTLKTRLPR